MRLHQPSVPRALPTTIYVRLALNQMTNLFRIGSYKFDNSLSPLFSLLFLKKVSSAIYRSVRLTLSTWYFLLKYNVAASNYYENVFNANIACYIGTVNPNRFVKVSKPDVAINEATCEVAINFTKK
jgi:hypothetical protein